MAHMGAMDQLDRLAGCLCWRLSVSQLFPGYGQWNFVAGDADRPAFIAYIIYYAVIGLFLTLSLTLGRIAGCHAIYWMAPFMIIGRKIRNLLKYPALQLKADASKCTDCLTCTRNYPMSMDVNALVKRGNMEHSECILCGNCMDSCSSSVIRYSL
jgi:Pyruvate/2-oxoacid:ferredoxin oxidoreductase delta subunit